MENIEENLNLPVINGKIVVKPVKKQDRVRTKISWEIIFNIPSPSATGDNPASLNSENLNFFLESLEDILKKITLFKKQSFRGNFFKKYFIPGDNAPDLELKISPEKKYALFSISNGTYPLSVTLTSKDISIIVKELKNIGLRSKSMIDTFKALTGYEGRLIWEFSAGGKISFKPCFLDGYIYFGCDDNNFYCLDAKSGEEIWHFKAGNWIWTSPAAADGYIYFGSLDNFFYCLDAKSGEEIWKFEAGDEIKSSPLISDGLIYFGVINKNFYCLDAKSGRIVWDFITGGEIRACADFCLPLYRGKGAIISSPTISNGLIYFGADDHYFYCLDGKSGKQVWKTLLNGAIYSSPSIADGLIYFGCDDYYLYCLDAVSGKIVWKIQTGYNIRSCPCIFNGLVYFESDDYNFYCLDAKTGAKIWIFKAKIGWEVAGLSSSPSIYKGLVYFGSDDHNFYCLDAKTGERIWHFETGANIKSTPCIVDGYIYFGSDDCTLYCLNSELE